MKSDYVIYGTLIVVVIVILGYTMRDLISGNPVPEASAQNIQRQALTKTTGSTSMGDVQIDLTPKGIVDGKFTVGFAANTHSVTMDNFDLKEMAILEYNGKNYYLVSAPKLSGHHNFGDLVFELSEAPKNFKIIIKGIPSIQERVFEWK